MPKQTAAEPLKRMLDEAQAIAGERLRSPLLGSFAAAWCIYNYQFLMILFSDAGLQTTQFLLKTAAYSSPGDRTWRQVVAPLLVAITYTFLYPFVARGVYLFHYWVEKGNSEWKKRIEGSQLISREEADELAAKVKAADEQVKIAYERVRELEHRSSQDKQSFESERREAAIALAEVKGREEPVKKELDSLCEFVARHAPEAWKKYKGS
jgi:hypothetical protein